MPKVILGVKLYSIREAAELLDVTYSTALSYVNKGRIKAQLIGGRKLISEENLREFLLQEK